MLIDWFTVGAQALNFLVLVWLLKRFLYKPILNAVDAREAADVLSAKRQETLRSEAHNLNQAIRRRTQQEVFAIARKTLTDLATTSLEERIGGVFTRHLRTMDDK